MRGLHYITVLCVFTVASCANAEYEIKNIHQYCLQDVNKTDIAKKLGFEPEKMSKFYKLADVKKMRYSNVTLNPQDGTSIQSIFLLWNKNPGISAAEIISSTGANIPINDKSKYKKTDEDEKSIYQFTGLYENIMRISIQCKKDNLNNCWSIKFECSEFIHD